MTSSVSAFRKMKLVLRIPKNDPRKRRRIERISESSRIRLRSFPDPSRHSQRLRIRLLR
jgi:hypothetical protein